MFRRIDQTFDVFAAFPRYYLHTHTAVGNQPIITSTTPGYEPHDCNYPTHNDSQDLNPLTPEHDRNVVLKIENQGYVDYS